MISTVLHYLLRRMPNTVLPFPVFMVDKSSPESQCPTVYPFVQAFRYTRRKRKKWVGFKWNTIEMHTEANAIRCHDQVPRLAPSWRLSPSFRDRDEVKSSLSLHQAVRTRLTQPFAHSVLCGQKVCRGGHAEAYISNSQSELAFPSVMYQYVLHNEIVVYILHVNHKKRSLYAHMFCWRTKLFTENIITFTLEMAVYCS